ncbi:lactate utilization protein C [Paenibacillus tritici]|jgi:L-lactate dehydrogenase complex protein LldG|uniref:Lactate utilization protein C n=1 Tax=Paenibacillus tritici TaxID=1873425 RepID=A0ABX2DKU7_9BACL|nr:lactate utilization protein C [Paenibacillus tritici]NQX44279.1 lactate utilization protein C [Paenibacillus tritici]QUL57892.1 lactate utilization protein C [Paenibacillus tritici]
MTVTTNKSANRNTNKEAFLNTIASKLGRERRTEVQRPAIQEFIPDSYGPLTTDDLVEILKEQCFFIHTQVIESTPEILQQTLSDLIEANGGGTVMLSGDRRFNEYGLAFPDAAVWEETAGRVENIRRAESANTAIVFADCALAESGTVVLESRPDQGRSLHFLPAHYIAVIERRRLVLRSTQAAAELNRRIQAGEPVGSAIQFISGPSNSADIEMKLVVGVHGPLRATYVLI